MKWTKTGRIFEPHRGATWCQSHAQLPVVHPIGGDVLRIYYGTRNELSQTVTTYIDVDAGDPHRILYAHPEPVLGLGELGRFDDGGAMPSWVVKHGGLLYLYYIGWNAGVTVSYRNSIGLAISDDGGASFSRRFAGPILDRTRDEPHFCGASCVLVDKDGWHMWYLSAIRWESFEGHPEPVYNLKYASSDDGLEWTRRGIVAIDLASSDEGGITRPCVLPTRDGWEMWYCYRGIRDYRSNPENSYRIGYATSVDRIRWERRDSEAGIDVSPEGWDSEMITYAHVYEHAGHKHMIYNGNGFGASGFGHAMLTDNGK